jgi:hypothetical protein
MKISLQRIRRVRKKKRKMKRRWSWTRIKRTRKTIERWRKRCGLGIGGRKSWEK